MTRNQALEKYLQCSPRGAGVVKKIMTWDAKKTLQQNINDCNIANYTGGLVFARRFDLKYIQLRKMTAMSKKQSIEKLVKSGLKQTEIALLLNLSRQRIEQILHT